MKIIRLVIVAVIILLLVLFIVYNNAKVSVEYLSMHFDNMPIWLVVFISVFSGMIMGWFFMFVDELSIKKNIKDKDKELKALKEEIAQLRQLTISDSEDK